MNFQARIENIATHAVSLPSDLGFGTLGHSFVELWHDGRNLERKGHHGVRPSLAERIFHNNAVELAPGEATSVEFTLNKLFDMTHSGVYIVKYKALLFDGEIVEAEPITLSVADK